MLALLFGSSARRGATGWTDVARVSSLLATALPDVVIEGESPCGGADALAREVAESLGIAVDPYPQRDDVDGPRGFLRRNERMHRDGRPDVAAGFVSGKVGTPLSGGSAHMAGICVRAGTPLVIFREDGVELPHVTDPECRGDRIAGDLYHARRMLVGLHRAAPWAREAVLAADEAARTGAQHAADRGAFFVDHRSHHNHLSRLSTSNPPRRMLVAASPITYSSIFAPASSAPSAAARSALRSGPSCRRSISRRSL